MTKLRLSERKRNHAHNRNIALAMSESELLACVIDLAKLYGWMVQHQRPGRLQDGQWRTTIEGDAGFPDLVLARGGITLTIELKSQKGRLSPEQQDWQRATNGLVWRPSHWLNGEVEKVLK